MASFRRLLLITWILNAYDAAITIYATQKLGASELNPLLRVCLAVSPTFFVVVKIAVITAVCLALGRHYKNNPRRTRIMITVSLVLFLVIAVWNTGLVVRYR